MSQTEYEFMRGLDQAKRLALQDPVNPDFVASPYQKESWAEQELRSREHKRVSQYVNQLQYEAVSKPLDAYADFRSK